MSYDHTKLLHHRLTGGTDPVTVHLMPQNTCNHGCSFCSYRLDGWKNSEAFDEGQHLNRPTLLCLLADFEEMGVQGVEVTGGGEPLAHPDTEFMWELLGMHAYSKALVTNGTLLKDLAPLIAPQLKWARVSIDAGSKETYSKMRRCPESHWDKAWDAVAQLREHAPDDPEFRLGVGFVACRENWGEVETFVERAKLSGADNVRLSMAFGVDWAGAEAARGVADGEAEMVEWAAGQSDGDFVVHNLLSSRVNPAPTQDYPSCPTSESLAVVEGSGKVYPCCTLTGSNIGVMGNVNERSFRDIWEDRKTINPSEMCRCPCLYRPHNLAALEAMKRPLHAEFV